MPVKIFENVKIVKFGGFLTCNPRQNLRSAFQVIPKAHPGSSTHETEMKRQPEARTVTESMQ